MMVSTVANNVSTTPAPLSANLSRNRRCLRARATMIASAYSYRTPSIWGVVWTPTVPSSPAARRALRSSVVNAFLALSARVRAAVSPLPILPASGRAASAWRSATLTACSGSARRGPQRGRHLALDRQVALGGGRAAADEQLVADISGHQEGRSGDGQGCSSAFA